MYHHQKYYLISELGIVERAIRGPPHGGDGWHDLCTNRFHFYCDGVIRDLSGNLTLLGRNYFV